ncbi:hypothetical protein DSO57_1005914 [Entomophthora muscae]|uniref:Uncharacterized protein n=1 Tax=Entomophthora muscae TaxID=34485 RepID=A0ACC2S9W4_9FUNG|nr:hypothetical protein DSO57_1005914 [Entomophthora muscae]
MALGLVFNAVALCVVLRQDLRMPDLRLALIMAVSEILLVVFKLCDSLYFATTPVKEIPEDAQWKGVVTSFLLQLSAVCVGCLALLRFWVIFMKRTVPLRLFWTLFVVLQTVMLSFLIAVAYQGWFESLHIMSLLYPELNTRSWVVETCRYLLLINHIWPIVAVNIIYPCIARIYESELMFLHPGDPPLKQKRMIYFKVGVFIVVYNIAMIPNILVLLLEALTGKLQSPFIESISVVTLFSMTLFNPLILLTLHHETFREFKMLAHQLKSKLRQ